MDAGSRTSTSPHIEQVGGSDAGGSENEPIAIRRSDPDQRFKAAPTKFYRHDGTMPKSNTLYFLDVYLFSVPHHTASSRMIASARAWARGTIESTSRYSS